MSGIFCILTLSVVLVLIQRQSMNAYAVVTCEPLKTPPGAILTTPCNSTYGSKCVYTCDVGFSMTTEEGQARDVTRTCSQPGQWLGNSINCTANQPTSSKPSSTPKPDSSQDPTGLNSTTNQPTSLRPSSTPKPDSSQDPTGLNSTTNQPTSLKPLNPFVRNLSPKAMSYKPASATEPDSSQDPTSLNTISTPELHSNQTSTTPTTPNGRTLTTNVLQITVILGCLFLITLTAFAIFCLLTRLRSNAPTRSFDTEESMEQDNLAYRQTRSLPDNEFEMKAMVPPQPDAGLSKPHIYPGGHCQTLDNANGRPDNFFQDPLDSNGATGTQSEVENELNALDLENECSNEPLLSRPPTSLPESIKKLEAPLFSTGGKFSAEGCSNWERVPNESERVNQFKAISTGKEDASDSKAWEKRATVFASRPNPRNDLIYIRFYVYSDNEDSKMRLELEEKERFPDSKPAREQSFRMYNGNKVITVRLTNLEEGWECDKTNDTQIYCYDEASGNGFCSKNACDFAVKPVDGRDVNGFSCIVKFQLENDHQEYLIYLNPGFTPVKRESIRRKPAAGGQRVTASSNTYAIATCSTSTGPEEEKEDRDSHNHKGRSSKDFSRDKGYAQRDHFFTSLGLDNDKLVTEAHLCGISPHVGVKWKRVLRKLSIEEAIIRNLEEDNKNATVDEKCYQGLLAWKEGRGPHGATIKTLCDALQDVDCSGALNALRREIAPRISHC